ncbi:MAG: glycosyltransferase family 2 protein [Polyangiaceae bacterium]
MTDSIQGVLPRAPVPMRLRWSLAVPTLDREDVLVRSLRANILQSRPPAQVVVVDASAAWERTRDRVLAEVAPELPGAEWIYLGSKVRSLTHQRNLGLGRCTGDVVFFLDDDSFMYRSCAEEVMRVYEADEGEEIGGVCADLADRLEGAAETDGEHRKGISGLLVNVAHRQWLQERLFIPYDGRFHERPVPGLGRLGGDVEPARLFHGCRMTFRASAVRAAGGFEEMLTGACYGEDIDVSYRVSRDKALVMARRAALRHEQVPVARPRRELNTALVVLNAIALYRIHGREPGATAGAARACAFLLRRAALELLRDCARARRGMPCTRGVMRAVKYAPTVLSLEGDALRKRYIDIQRELYAACS